MNKNDYNKYKKNEYNWKKIFSFSITKTISVPFQGSAGFGEFSTEQVSTHCNAMRKAIEGP